MKRIILFFFSLLTLTSSAVFAAPADIWESGQKTCYATSPSRTIISCTGTGQDGDFRPGVAWPNPRFSNNVFNGTVTDNLTGLIWLKDANCFGTKTWDQALASANNLADGQCGLADGSQAGDWRLPSRKELFSLVDFEYEQPSLSNTAGTGQWTAGVPFDGVQSYFYWSSTTYAPSTADIWIIDMWSGSVSYGAKTSNYSYVWPVRGGQFGPFGNLTISKFDANAGTVKSNPAGINCGISYSTCSMQFPLNRVVTLLATPSTGGSIFSGWSGDPDCADGIVTLSADKSCTAIFSLCDSASTAMIGSSALFGSINDAYIGAASTDTIKVIASNQQEGDLVFNGKNLTLQGGYDCAFAEPPTSMTIITNSLTISGGSVSIGGIRIQ